MRFARVLGVGLVLGILLGVPGDGQESRYATIDRHAMAAPPAAEASLEALAAYLVRPARTGEERARSVYRWVTARISYDVEALLSGNKPDQNAEAVLRRRTAVCAGYSQLYAALAREAGLDVAVVSGDCRVVPGKPPESHAWNAVRLGGKWRLLDSTWGAGWVDRNGRAFHREFQNHYFLTPPEQLIFTHFPEEPRWQLLGRQRPRQEFESYPIVSSSYFACGIEALELHGYLVAEGSARLRFKVPSGVKLSGQLVQDSGKLPENLVFGQRDERTFVVDTVFPRAGEYRLEIYATKSSRATRMERCMQYRVKATRGTRDAEFPRLSSTFLERNAFLDAPLTGKLRSGRPVPFRLRVPGALEVNVVTGERWQPLQRKAGDRFSGDIPLRPGKASVFARFPGDTQHWSLLEYSVAP
ncbi:MAG: transglutaminase domain-containing protein [Candidatus Eremiobacterota bacterium]